MSFPIQTLITCTATAVGLAAQSGIDEAGSSSAPALAASQPLTASQRTAIHTAPDDPEGGAYGIWGAGQDYKASFHGRPTFIPYLGADYPHNQPLEWTTQAILIGGRLVADAHTRAEHRQTDYRYEYDYGPVTEAYDVLSGGLEQTFVLEQPPAGPGDFVVRGQFASRMTVVDEFDSAHRPIEFADQDGRVLVRYGAAFAVDATGRRLALDTTVRDDQVTLTIPAQYLAEATYPVVLDPLTTPVQINAGAEVLETHVARDDRSNSACLTYTRAVSATDADAWGFIAPDGLGTIGTNVFSDLTSSWSTPQTSTCNVGTSVANRFVICIHRTFSTSSGIRYWHKLPTDLTLTTTVRGISTSGLHNWNPDCGGIEAYNQNGQAAIGDTALLVWQRDPGGSGGPAANNGPNSAIYGAVVTFDNVANTAIASAPFAIAESTTRDREYPSVTKVSAGDPGTGVTDWMVAYQEYNNTITADDWDAYAERVFSNGTREGVRWFPSISGGAHRVDLRIAGQRGRYLVHYGRIDEPLPLTKVSSLLSNQSVVERFNLPIGGSVSKRPAQNLSLLQSGTTLRTHSVAYDADGDSIWTAMWAAPGGSGRIFVHRTGYNGAALEVERLIPTPGQSFGESDLAFNDDANNFVVAHGASTGEIYGSEMEYPVETPFSVTGSSCSTATISWRMRDADMNIFSNSGQDQQIGLEFTYCEVVGMPSNTLSILGVGFDTANIDLTGVAGVAPGCFNLLDTAGSGFVGFFDFQIGTSGSWRLPLPEQLAATDIVYCQVWHINSAGNAFVSTPRLEVPIIK